MTESLADHEFAQALASVDREGPSAVERVEMLMEIAMGQGVAMCLGIPGQIVEIVDAASKLATVNVAGIKRTINVACIVGDEQAVESCVGAWVLVHVGFAMSRIDAAEAEKTLALLAELGEAQAEIEAMQDGDVINEKKPGAP